MDKKARLIGWEVVCHFRINLVWDWTDCLSQHNFIGKYKGEGALGEGD